MTDYNYFDVEDFSVDSFFRSLELQSRFASNELEFSFAADLDNVPMSTVGCLESSRATSSNADRHLSAGDDMQECGTSSVESSADTSMNDAENAAAVDVFFRSLQLQSCLLRTDGESDGSRRCRADKSRSAGGDLLVQSQNDAEKSTCSSSVDGTTADPKLTLSGNWRDDVTACSSEKSPTNFDGRDRLSHLPNRSDVAARGSRLSPRRRTELNGSSSSCVEGRQRDCQTGSQQSSSSSAHAAQPETTAVASTSSSTCVGHMSNLSATCGATGETPSLLDQADPACSRDQPQTNPRPAETLCGGDQQQWVPDVGENGQFVGLSATERRQSERGRGGGVKGGRMWCGECGVMLSDKYCYVRHLLTPLHRRRADGYCVIRDSSSSSATATGSTCTGVNPAGDTSPNILVGGTSTGISPPQYYYVLSDIADQYWLSSIRSASSRFHSAIRRHQFASVPSHTPPHCWFVLTPLGTCNSFYCLGHFKNVYDDDDDDR